MRTRTFTCAALLAIASVALSGCGDDDDDPTPAATATATEATTAPSTTASDRGGYGESPVTVPAGGDTSVMISATDLGEVIAGGGGYTLYIFTPDNAGAPTCVAECAGNWPPATGDGAPSGGDGVDASMLGTVTHPEGGEQLTYDGWPLYYFAGDSSAGDTNGQGQGGVWFAIGSDGEPIQ